MTPVAQIMRSVQETVWENIGVRKHLVGRRRVAAATLAVISRWPPDQLAGSGDADIQSAWQSDLCQYAIERTSDSRKYGVIWAYILSAVIAQIVRVLLEWWLRNRDLPGVMDRLRTAAELGLAREGSQ